MPYESLQRYLRLAGARVSRAALASWTTEQRYEAYRWAMTLMDDLPEYRRLDRMPAHVAAAHAKGKAR